MEPKVNVEATPSQRNVFYVFMRKDLDSMVPGKAIAQGTHAADDRASHMRDKDVSEVSAKAYEEWLEESKHHGNFGTTLTLGVTDWEGFKTKLQRWQRFELDVESNIIRDDTYPLRDGLITHYIDIETCAWAFVPCGVVVPEFVRELELY